MRVTIAHNSSPAGVRARIDEEAANVAAKAKGVITNAHYAWNADIMTFTATAMGATVNGTVEVTPTEVIVDARLPLFLRPFEGRAQSRILGELREMFD